MRWLMRFQWDEGAETLDLSLPPQLWRESVPSIGGSGRSAAGVASGYVVRRDYLLAMPIRFRADEWEALLELLAWAQTGAPVVWTPDVAEPLTTYTVTLESPAAGERIEPDYDPTFPQVRVLSVVWRNAADAPFALDYFG